MTTRLLVGDVFQRMAELDDGSFELIVTSPPFLALRSYLPDGHPDKAKEIGSEATPADYLDTLLALTAEWRRLLAPHGSLAVELGDKYSGSGGAGGDYGDEGWRAGQNRFGRMVDSPDVPLGKSLLMLPTLYPACLAYGRNLLTGQPSPAGRWRVRNLKPWIRSNPPVGALGDKERPATSYITVACVGASRWFDLDAVRTAGSTSTSRTVRHSGAKGDLNGRRDTLGPYAGNENAAGAPPLDWWHPVDAVIDQVIDQMAKQQGETVRAGGGGPKTVAKTDGMWSTLNPVTVTRAGARGVHIRRALTQAGLLPPGDFYDVSPRGYSGAHYAVWPPELVRQLIDEMCPRRVCRECGEPSRRLVGDTEEYAAYKADNQWGGKITSNLHRPNIDFSMPRRAQLGWSDCGHNNWRPGRILDPFSGSGTTLAVASGMGRDSVGIDLDQASYGLTRGRVGPLVWAMEFSIDWPAPNWDAPVLPRADGDYAEWAHMLGEAGRLAVEEALEDKGGPWWLGPPQRDQMAARYERRNGRRPVVNVPGQGGLFTDEAMA